MALASEAAAHAMTHATHSIKLGAAALAVCALLTAGNVVAFFGDRESSEENTFGAGSLGIALAIDGDGDYHEMTITADEAEDVEYRLSFNISGDPFCDDLSVRIKQDGSDLYHSTPALYESPLSTLSANDTDDWVFNFGLENAASTGGSCMVTATFEANQNGYTHGEAFFDTETYTFTLTGADFGLSPMSPNTGASPLQTDNVVLNEVYANEITGASAPLEREWVELYNGSSTAIDVQGWDIGENTLVHTISETDGCVDGALDGHARPYDSASTLIQPGGYLVIEFCAASVLNDDGDTITLYDASDVPVNDYSYTATVEGKSDARIPDGGSWVDPIPTPGAPNKNERFVFKSEITVPAKIETPDDPLPPKEEEMPEEPLPPEDPPPPAPPNEPVDPETPTP